MLARICRDLGANAAMLAGALALCAASVPTTEADSGMKTLTIEDNGQVLDLPVGTSLTLRLESTPGTGFAWEVVDRAAGSLKLLGEPHLEPCPEGEGRASRPLGAPSCQVFRFEAANRGTGSLRLEYKRRWETTVAPEKRFSVELHIE
jgi:predicted secreted protein